MSNEVAGRLELTRILDTGLSLASYNGPGSRKVHGTTGRVVVTSAA
jgi:hypothetical protein